MDDVIGFGIMILFICGSVYGLLQQMKYSNVIRNRKDLSQKQRLLYVNYLCCFSYIGFIITFSLNIFVGIFGSTSTILTSNSTGLACIIFLIILLITKYGIIGKSVKRVLSIK